jgi:hypothetical protein
MNDPETPEQQQPEERREPTETTTRRAPFDISGLNDIPQARDDDPPYQNWWVIPTR